MGEVPRRRYQCLPKLERKHWTPEKKLSPLVLEWWENLLIYNIKFPVFNIECVIYSGKWGEISETLERRWLDICCLEEVRWKGQGAKMNGNGYKFVWSGGCKAENSVGVIVSNWLIGKFVVNIVTGHVVWEVVSCYCLQAGRSINEKDEFY